MKKRLFILSLLLLAGGLGSDAAAQRLEKLEILQDNYPRAGYFRIAEFSIRWHYAGMEEKYDEWSRRMSDLSGIMGKTEYEELIVNNPHRQIYNWFRRFKEDYSHFNVAGALELFRRGGPREAYLTNMSHDIGLHAETEPTLPAGVRMAYDTLQVACDD